MAFILINTNSRTGRTSYWQTPWISRERIVDDAGHATYDADGNPRFKRNSQGQIMWREIGGWTGKAEYATQYASREEAEAVVLLRQLEAQVEAW